MKRLHRRGLVFKWGIEIRKTFSHHVLFRCNRVLHLPVDVQIFVVEEDTTFGGLVVEGGALVGENGVVFQRGETMREAGRQVKLAEIVGGEQRGDILPIGGTAFADIDGKIEDRTAQHAHELGLRKRRLLEMQSAHHTLLRTRLVVLHEIVRNS